MKTNAIVRIVLFSLAILLLLSILGSALMARTFLINIKESGIVDLVHDIFSVGEPGDIRIDGTGSRSEFDASQIRDLKIEWITGAIIIQVGNTDTICVEESSVSDSKYQMVARRSGNRLTLKFCDDDFLGWKSSTKIDTDISKDLVITVPKNWKCDNLEIDTASARVEICDLQIHEVDFDGASGLCVFENCEIEELDIDTASGDVCFSGILNSLDFDAASANCIIDVTNIPRSIEMDGMSGNLELILPPDAGFICNLHTMSGSFESNFNYQIHDRAYVCGSGECKINVNGMSGDVTILKGIK